MNKKIYSYSWLGLENLFSFYIDPHKKLTWENDIEYKKQDEINPYIFKRYEINQMIDERDIFENVINIRDNYYLNNPGISFYERKYNSNEFQSYNYDNSNKYLNMDYIIEWDKDVI